MKKVYLITFYLFTFILLVAQGVQPQIGDGSQESPYEINTLDNLVWMSNNQQCWESNFIQTADIDATATQNMNSNQGFKPIGDNLHNYDWNKFNGFYNGMGFTITHLFIDRPMTNYVGLFGYAENARIYDVTLNNVDITGNSMVGGIIGIAAENSSIVKCTVDGNITANDDYVGSIAGMIIDNSEVYLANVTTTINGSFNKAGGITGSLRNNSSISNSHANSTIQAMNNFAGGITGEAINNTTIEYSSSLGDVTGYNFVGGLVGKNSGLIQYSNAEGDISGNSTIGGFVGLNEGGIIHDCYATGNVSGSQYNAGGFVANNNNNGIIEHCYCSGITTGNTNVGSFLGFNGGNSQVENVLYLNSNPLFPDNELAYGNNQSGNVIINQMDIMESLDILTYTNLGFNFTDNWMSSGGLPYMPWVSTRIYTPQNSAFIYTNVAFYSLFGIDNLSLNDNIIFEWDFDNDGIVDSNAMNPTHQFTAEGIYNTTLKITDTDNGREFEFIQQMYVSELLIAMFDVDNLTPELNDIVTFNDMSTGTPVAWEWDFDNDGIVDSTDQNPSLEIVNPGYYTVSLMVTNAFGETATTIENNYLAIFGEVNSDFSYHTLDNTQSIESNTDIVFVNESTGIITTTLWDFGDGTFSNELNPIKSYTFAGDYEVTLTVSNPNSNSSFPSTVSIIPLQNPTTTNWEGSIELTTDFTLPADSTLVIAEGTEVSCGEGVTMTIEGNIEGNGVNFISSENWWQGIVMNNGSRSSSLADCSFENANTPILLNSSSLNLSNCNIVRTLPEVAGDNFAIEVINNGSVNIDSLEISGYSEGLRIVGTDRSLRTSHTLNNINLDTYDSTAGKGLYVSDANVSISNSQFNNFLSGIEIITTPGRRSRSVVSLSNIKLTTSESISTATATGIKLSNTNVVTDGIDVSGYDVGIELDDNSGLELTLLTGVRVKNSSNSSRTDRIGIKVENVKNFQIEADSLINVEKGIVLVNSSETGTCSAKIANTNLLNLDESRAVKTGISAKGSFKVNLENISIEGYSTGVEIDNNGSIYADEGLDIPLLTGVRVKNSSNSSRITSKGISIKNACSPNITNIEIDDYDIGLELNSEYPLLDDDEAFMPLLTGVRVRNSSNSSRVSRTAILVNYRCSPQISDIDIDGYDNGIVFSNLLESEDIIAPLLTGVRIKNSSNSSRAETYGILIERPSSIELSDITLSGFTTGIKLSTPDYNDCLYSSMTDVTIYNNTDTYANNVGIDIDGCYSINLSAIEIDSTAVGISAKNIQPSPASINIESSSFYRSYDFEDYDEQAISLSNNYTLNFDRGSVNDFPIGVYHNGLGQLLEGGVVLNSITFSMNAENIEPTVAVELYDVPVTLIQSCFINYYDTAVICEAIELDNVTLTIIDTQFNGSELIRTETTAVSTNNVSADIKKSSFSSYSTGISYNNSETSIIQNNLFKSCEVPVSAISLVTLDIKNNVFDTTDGFNLYPIYSQNIESLNLDHNTIPYYQYFGNFNNSYINIQSSIMWSGSALEMPFMGDGSEYNINNSIMSVANPMEYGDSNSNLDPMFMDYENGDYSLTSQSPGISGNIGAGHYFKSFSILMDYPANQDMNDYFIDAEIWDTYGDFAEFDEPSMANNIEIGNEIHVTPYFESYWEDIYGNSDYSLNINNVVTGNYWAINGISIYELPESDLRESVTINTASSDMNSELVFTFLKPGTYTLSYLFNYHGNYIRTTINNIVVTDPNALIEDETCWANNLSLTVSEGNLRLNWSVPEIASENTSNDDTVKTYKVYGSNDLEEYDLIETTNNSYLLVDESHQTQFYKVQCTVSDVGRTRVNTTTKKALRKRTTH